MTYQIIAFVLIPVLFAVVRVMRGGLGPQPPRPMMWAMPPLTVAGLTWSVDAWPLVVLSLLLSAQYNDGYGDKDGDGVVGWNDAIWDMTIRSLPSVGFGVCVTALWWSGYYSVNLLGLWAAILLNVEANLIQPWFRTRMDDIGPWGDHSNRYAEFLEGVAVGILCVSVT